MTWRARYEHRKDRIDPGPPAGRAPWSAESQRCVCSMQSGAPSLPPVRDHGPRSRLGPNAKGAGHCRPARAGDSRRRVIAITHIDRLCAAPDVGICPEACAVVGLRIAGVGAERRLHAASYALCSGASSGGGLRYGVVAAERARWASSTVAARCCALSVRVAENETRAGARPRGVSRARSMPRRSSAEHVASVASG
jgi:hypothetical protein